MKPKRKVGIIRKVLSEEQAFLVQLILNDIKKFKRNAVVNIGYSLSFSKEYKLVRYEIAKEVMKAKVDLGGELYSDKYKDMGLFIAEDDIVFKHKEGYFVSDLLDCEVINSETGEAIGRLIDVYVLPANDVWIIETKEGELPIPYIDEVVKEVDLPRKRIKINLLEGLLELCDAQKKNQKGREDIIKD